MRSLRARLLYRTTGVLLLTFVVAALALYILMRTALLAEIDAALLLEARALASHVEQIGEQVNVELDLAIFPEYSTAERPHFFQIWNSESHCVARSPSLTGRDLDLNSGAVPGPTHAFVVLPNGRAGREVSLVFQPQYEDDHQEDEPSNDSIERPFLTLGVARQTTELEGTLGTLRWMLLAVTLAAALISIALTSGVVQHELRPLQTLAQSIERVGVSELSRRIALEGCPDEVVPVVHRLNDLLGRLDEAMAREKSFTADAAHELRTPLAGLETALEVCASRPRDPQMYQDIIQKCLRITQAMHAMVNNLLTLARADARQLTAQSEPIEMAAFLRDCWLPFEVRASQKQLRVEWRLKSEGTICIDKEKMRVVLTNLFDNGVTYTNEAGWIQITTAADSTQYVISIANSGCRLNPADVVRVFDRFWRGDEARSEAGLRCGVGLSLCRKIIEILGGSIAAQIVEGTFTVTIAIPLAQAAGNAG